MNAFLEALSCRNCGTPPVWLMRQAGRYLPAYRKLKQNRSLLEMFHHKETIVEVTLLPFQSLPLDAAILFSDILTVLDGLHIRYDFLEGSGPVILDPISKITILHPEPVYHHIREAIQLLKKELKVPLLGFAGAPFTIASYLIEGKTSKDLKKTKHLFFTKRPLFLQLLEDITQATIDYLNVQIDAGVDAIQLFDSWAHALAIDEFRLLSLKPMQRLVEAIKKRNIPVILFCRGSCLFADELASLMPSAISLDWSGDLGRTRARIPASIAVQGNLDPMFLYSSQEEIAHKVDHMLRAMQGDKGYIFNLGHGVLPDTPYEKVQFLVNYVKNR